MMRHMEFFDKVVYFTACLLLLLVAGAAYEYTYPWTIIKVHSFRIMQTPVYAGHVLWYEVCATKYLPIPGKVIVSLHNSTDRTLKISEADAPPGYECKQTYAYIPSDVREDTDYWLSWQVSYDPTKLARTKIYRALPSEKFEIIGAPVEKGEKGDRGPRGYDGYILRSGKP